MNIEEARRQIIAGNARERLDAARTLAADATPGDTPLIAQALRAETVSWVRGALEEAAIRASGKTATRIYSSSDVDLSAVDDVYGQAIEETTGQLLHEISPIVGAVRTYAELEVPDYAQSQVSRQLDRLDLMLEAIQALSRAAAAPRPTEFNLAEAIAEVITDATQTIASVEVQTAGPDPLILESDQTLVCLVVRNGLVNAMEASLAVEGDAEPPRVGIRWDETDRDYWVAVLDRGIGLPPTAGQVFEIGVSGKRSHLGMGLALATRAALSLQGRITLTPRKDGGTQFLFRWLKPPQT